jgi:M6 family metalloprotease-like protein
MTGWRYIVRSTSLLPIRHPTSILVHRILKWMVGVAAFAAACSDPTAPLDFDIRQLPYVKGSTGVRLFGTSRVLVVPARFADGAPPSLSSNEIAAQLFSGAGGGPITQSFALASGNGFTLRGQVTKWVTTSVTIEGFAQPGGPSQESGLGQYIKDAIRLVDGDVNFGLYDNDGRDGKPDSGDDDGVVDGGIVIFNSETSRYCNGGTGRGPHPFAVTRLPIGARFSTADVGYNGGILEIAGYTLMSATGCGGPNVGAHVMAHELGHLFLGLPDMYHQLGGNGEVWATRRWVSGCWELMAAGAWGCGTGAPTLDYRFNTLGAWTRTVLGWATPMVADVNTAATYELNPLGRGGTVLRVPIKPDEYLLLEYREGAPGDPRLPGNGVLIFHVAESLPQFPTSLQSSYRVSLIEADDDSSLFRTELQGGNRGTPGDAFGITRTTFRAGEHSRAKAVDGVPFFFEVTDIAIDAAAHRARVRVAPILAPGGSRH